LNCMDNEISDLSPLYNSTSLTKLNCCSCPIQDPINFSDFKSLIDLLCDC